MSGPVARRGLSTRMRSTRTRVLGGAVFSLAAAAFVVAAVHSDGYKASNIDLDDGTVWVTNGAAGLVGRLNIKIDELDFSLAGYTAPDVEQSGRHVFVDGGDTGVQSVAVETGVVGTAKNGASLPNYAIGGGVGAAINPTTGDLWTGPSATMVA